MPRNVRNFWIEIEVDGRKERIACGPQAAEGGFRLTIKQRASGGIIDQLLVTGEAVGEGGLELQVVPTDRMETITMRTCR